MSLDVYLNMPGVGISGTGIFIRENGSIREITRAEWDNKFPNQEPVVIQYSDDDNRAVYSANITHNLGDMADKAGIYEALWRPEEIGITHAHQLIELLRAGIVRLIEQSDYLAQFNPENGWGDYAGLLRFTEQYLDACERYPQAEVEVWR